MIRASIMRRARPTLVSMLAAVAIAAPVPVAWSQDRGLQDRIDRLEKDLTMLQRQVYRGPAMTGGSPANAVDTELRIDRLETQMRELTGRVEDAVNEFEQLRRRLEQINSDIEVRFSQAQGQPRSAAPNSHSAVGISDASPAAPGGQIAMRGPAPVFTPAPSRASDSSIAPGAVVPPPRDPPTSRGTLTPPGQASAQGQASTSRESQTNVAVAGNPRPGGSALRNGSAPEQYNQAYGLLKQADYSAAEGAFKSFIEQHPNDPLAGSAQYWLGETFYVRGKYGEAATAFAEGYRKYPKGSKAADDLLKLGMSLARANQKQNACVALAQLDRDFPHSGAAIKDRATAEKKRLGC